MDAINMLARSRLLREVQRDFPNYVFSFSDSFSWNAAKHIVTYSDLRAPSSQACLLHELAHAQLNHTSYQFDIELLRQESIAWEYTQENLAPRYELQLEQDYIQECIETYRQWLYKRSLCPQCSQTGLQTDQKTYSCINCRSSWRVNDARQCYLRRNLIRK